MELQKQSLCSYGMIFLSQDLKMFVIIFIQNVQAFFPRLKTVGGEKYHHSPTFHKSSQIPMDHIPRYIISLYIISQ